jgi:signal transduction histidine kinase
MNGFLGGILVAWSLTQFALGVYFTLAYFVGRREREFFLFSLLCFAFSVASIGIAVDYLANSLEMRAFGDVVTPGALIFAAAFNVHFAMEFAQVEWRKRAAILLYVLVGVFSVLLLNGNFFSDYRVIEVPLFESKVVHGLGNPKLAAKLFFGVALLEAIAAITLLIRAYRAGRREALSSLLGVVLCVPAMGNDLAMASGSIESLSLMPHAFPLYAFGVAGTLLLRYRVAAGELLQTASSLRETSDELRHSYAELKLVQDELVRKKQLAAVGELAAAIAHEVRNPLAVIVNAVAGLRRTGLHENDRATLLNIVEEESGRLNRLVTDLLRFARPVEVKRSPVSLLELANRTRGVVGDDYEIRVTIEDDVEIQTVWVDPNLFRLVFDNLVANACQSMKDGGRVEIEVRRGELGGQLAAHVEIKDTGHGMDPQVKKRALDPFFTTRPSGTGLGLPIVQRIVEAHGGQLEISSGEGQGTTVILEIPIARPQPSDTNRSEGKQKVA